MRPRAPPGYATEHMCELRSLVHSHLEVSSSGKHESSNWFLSPLGRNNTVLLKKLDVLRGQLLGSRTTSTFGLHMLRAADES